MDKDEIENYLNKDFSNHYDSMTIRNIEGRSTKVINFKFCHMPIIFRKEKQVNN